MADTSRWTFTGREEHGGAWESAFRPASRIRFLSDSRIGSQKSILHTSNDEKSRLSGG
jgi:hypothetical protein